MLTSAYGGPRLTADVEGAFHATDLTTIVPSRWGNIPIAVERASAFDRTIDRLCTRGGRVRLQGCRG